VALEYSISKVRQFWILDFGFWILDFGFWILDYETALGMHLSVVFTIHPLSKISNLKSKIV
jgi:hypothetical protein